MATTHESPRIEANRMIGPVVLLVFGAIAGFFGSSAGWIAWLLGPVVLVVGVVGLLTHRRWGLAVGGLGLGLTVGVLAYLGLGWVQSDGPSTMTGRS